MPRTWGTSNAQRYAAAPPVGVAGDTYFNTASKLLYVSDGTQWIAVGATTPPEVNVSTGGPAPRVGELLWVDTDESWGTRVEALEFVGPWAGSNTQTVSCPFKADVLVNWSASFYSTAVGMAAVALQLDGQAVPNWANYFFNETSSHKEASAAVVWRALAAGAHTWAIVPATNATSDGNDRGHLGLTYIAVP